MDAVINDGCICPCGNSTTVNTIYNIDDCVLLRSILFYCRLGCMCKKKRSFENTDNSYAPSCSRLEYNIIDAVAISKKKEMGVKNRGKKTNLALIYS